MKSLCIWLIPLLAIFSGWLAHVNGMSREASITLAVGVLTAGWWMFEAVPIPVASLVPIALLPFLGVLDAKTAVAQSYGHPLVLLLMGGFLLSKAMEKSGAHRRLALYMVKACGGQSGKRLVLGFMVASAMLSMWISNTATTLMLLPIGLAILEGVKNERMQTALMLGIAYSASIGGLGTPIGTPPNLVFIENYEKTTGTAMTFPQWMGYGVPVVVIMIPLMWLWISRGLPKREQFDIPDVGRWRSEEVRTLVVFGLTALAWVTRKAPFGGWSGMFGIEALQPLAVPGANDASVAFIGVILLFCLPNGMKPGEKLLNWEKASEIPFGMLLLFAGGICLAAGFKESGLSESIVGLMENLGNPPVIVLIAAVCLVMTFLTELTSNTASTILVMPILGSAAVANGIDPALLMLPAALSASCAFMLPVATAPNAVVFATGRFTVARMVREGLVLNLIGVVVISIFCWLLIGSRAS